LTLGRPGACCRVDAGRSAADSVVVGPSPSRHGVPTRLATTAARGWFSERCLTARRLSRINLTCFHLHYASTRSKHWSLLRELTSGQLGTTNPPEHPKAPNGKVPSLMQVRNYSDVLSAMSKAQLVITAVVLEGRSKCEVARDYDVSRQWVQQLCKRCLTRRGLHHPAVRWQSGRMRPESAPGPTRDDWATSGGSGVRRQVISSQVMSVR